MSPTRPAITLLAAFASLIAATGCQTSSYAERGAGFGALAGAATGAAIGNRSGNSGTGAVVGTAVGALTGAALGTAVDADVARNQAIVEQHMGRQMAMAVTVDDVVAMTSANLSEDVISNHIRAKGVAQTIAVGDLITMRNAGVSDGVIQAMQNGQAPQYPAQSLVQQPPGPTAVIVEEHYHHAPYYGPPRFYTPRPVRRHMPHRPHHHRSSGFHFSIGH